MKIKKIITSVLMISSLFMITSCGSTGPQGEQGLQGIQGIQGEKGEPGQNGVDGLTPIIGANGNWWIGNQDTGISAQGEKGDTGAEGPQGEKGETGQTGPQGEKGEAGNDAYGYGLECTVMYNLDGGTMSSSKTQIVTYGKTISLPEPTKYGHVFRGWYTGTSVNDGQVFNHTAICSDMNLTARWEALATYVIQFESNGGTVVGDITKPQGESINELPTPSRSDYIFAGWYSDEALSTRVTYPFTINSNVKLYAKWNLATYTLSFSLPSGTMNSVTYNAGDIVSEVSAPEIAGKNFVGWYTNSSYTTRFTFGNEIHANTKLYAKYEDVTYKLTYNTNGGSASSTVKSYKYGDTVSSFISVSKNGYIFQGWYLDESFSKKATTPLTINGDIQLYAKWIEDPYKNFVKVSNITDFMSISDMSKNYVLTADIDFGGATLDVIGSEQSPFTGVFDGNGHTLSNYTIRNSQTRMALFDTNNGVIRNLEIKGFNIIQLQHSSRSGGVCVTNNGTIENVKVDCNILCQNEGYGNMGGICVYNNGTISNVITSGILQNSSVKLPGTWGQYQRCGGASSGITVHNDGIIEYAISSASMSTGKLGSGWEVAGAITSYNNGTMRNCLFTGSLDGNSNVIEDKGSDTAVCSLIYKTSNASSISGGIIVPDSNLYTSNFFANTMKLDSEIWKYNNLSNGVLPTLWIFEK